ncbi:NAD-dependent epimerase/dehydratase family protein [Salinimonas sp. HHU 13199]|uniref:NAD-dependent epimerase/dehydratase family protein n=1 Tax=Salinimonas profundi TaxID=2729140 RepID=A0ABR8LPV6_9ALTE|nr:NAD-dependent epimerase/dehydratase family protein [Salinimonas profundi]MBD3586946.1 NAD-dependent epimerase/dehydratase family protein [Salinimonas profundi]
MTALTLCGCGWLGKQLAATASTTDIIGTTQRADNVSALRQLGVTPFTFQLGDDVSQLTQAAKHSTVVLNIPPGARKKPLDPEFVPQMCALIDEFFANDASALIFISTTAVYGDSENTVTEKTPVAPTTPSGKAHVEIEQHLLRQYSHKAAVFRLAGLVGADRHPVNFLAGRQLDKGEQVVNLVHGEDVCSAIHQWLSNPEFGITYHLCSLEHPKRGDYYPACARQRSLAEPEFNEGYEMLSPAGKRIDATASWQRLGLTPTYASPYDMI